MAPNLAWSVWKKSRSSGTELNENLKTRQEVPWVGNEGGWWGCWKDNNKGCQLKLLSAEKHRKWSLEEVNGLLTWPAWRQAMHVYVSVMLPSRCCPLTGLIRVTFAACCIHPAYCNGFMSSQISQDFHMHMLHTVRVFQWESALPFPLLLYCRFFFFFIEFV